MVVSLLVIHLYLGRWLDYRYTDAFSIFISDLQGHNDSPVKIKFRSNLDAHEREQFSHPKDIKGRKTATQRHANRSIKNSSR